MGDIITVLEHFSLAPANSAILAIILWLVWKLFKRFDELEGQCGVIQQIREHLAEHDQELGRHDERIKAIKDKE